MMHPYLPYSPSQTPISFDAENLAGNIDPNALLFLPGLNKIGRTRTAGLGANDTTIVDISQFPHLFKDFGQTSSLDVMREIRLVYFIEIDDQDLVEKYLSEFDFIHHAILDASDQLIKLFGSLSTLSLLVFYPPEGGENDLVIQIKTKLSVSRARILRKAFYADFLSTLPKRIRAHINLDIRYK